jgi:parvulin-like peptidyl-prolyl isomerase
VYSRRLLLRSLATAVVLAVVLTACGDAFHRPAAVVDDVAITDDGLRSQLPLSRLLGALQQQQCGSSGAGQPARGSCLRFSLSFLIRQAVVGRYASAHDVRVTGTDVRQAISSIQTPQEQVQALLDQFGVTRRQFDGLVGHLLIDQKVRQAVAAEGVSDSQLRAEYERRRLDFTLLRAAHILVASRAEAERISRQVTPGNFAALAKKFSTDQGSAQQGGDLGSIPAGQLDSDFVRAALALRPGEISAPVQTRFGWHIIRLIDVRVEPFEQARQQLLSELSGPAFQRWLHGQFGNGRIEVNPRYGRFDPNTGEVVALDTTATELPSPSPSAGQPSPAPSS